MKGSRNARGAEEWSKAGSFMRKPERGWLHSDQAIKDGGVCYALKYLGCIEVLRSMRTLQYDVRQQVTKEAMYRCCEANGYKFSKRKKAKSHVLKLLADHPRTVHSGTFISLTISIGGIVLTDMSSGEMISKHDMQGISFASGGEKECPDIVGYVAKDAKNKRACHVLDCPQNLSYDVINTIGQAFELRYKMFLDDPPQLLPIPKRFEDAIFGEDQATMEPASRDNTYENPRDDDEFADGDSDEFDDHEYDSVTEEMRKGVMEENDSKHEYQKPRPRQPPCEMSKYDTPRPGDPEYFTVEEEPQMNDLVEFAVGTQYDSAVKGPPLHTPSYNNPLASIPTVDNLANLNNETNIEVNGAAREVNRVTSLRTNWETFDGGGFPANRSQSVQAPSPTAPVMKMPSPTDETEEDDRSASLRHNSLGYALPLPKKPSKQPMRRTPPPLPKPYAPKNGNMPSNPTVEQLSPNSDNELLSKVWFHGPMSRQDAENLLVKDGDFLVRESTTNPGQYVLTGLQNGYPKHLLLIDPEGVVRTKDQSFDNVSHLVRYHQDNKVPIISSGSVLVLRQPVVKNDPSHSTYDRPV